MKKKILLFFLILSCFFIKNLTVSAEDEKIKKVYDEQLKSSGAKSLIENLPEETSKTLEEFGANKIDWQELVNIKPEKIFFGIFKIIKKISPTPIKCILCTLSVILICSLMDTFKRKISLSTFSFTLSAVSSLCISIAIAIPLVGFIEKSCTVIKMAGSFTFSYIPILTAIMLSSGQTITAGSYQILMIFASQAISYISASVLMPMLSSLLTLSIVSSISQKIDMSGICKFFYKLIKWILSLCMTVFVSFLTIQSIIGASADNIGSKTARFMISNLVPVVGRALSDAFTTVQSCMKLLKSSVGAFGIIATEFIFLPVVIEAILWLICIHFCSAVSDIFSLKKISILLSNCAKVVETTLSVILSSMIVLIISSVIILIISSNII